MRPSAPRAHSTFAGAALASIGLASLTWGLTAASAAGGIDRGGALAAGIGALVLLLFVYIESRVGDNAMLPLALFASRSFVGLNLLTFLLYGALGVLLVAVPFVLIEVGGYSATAAGAALLPLPIVIALASSTMGRIAIKTGARLPLTLAPLVVAAGFFLATRIGHGGYWSTTLPALLVIAFGMAGAVAPLTTAVLSSVDAGAHRRRLRLQQRGGALRRPDRHLAAGHDAGRARRLAGGGVPGRRDRGRRGGAGGRRLRIRLARSCSLRIGLMRVE